LNFGWAIFDQPPPYLAKFLIQKLTIAFETFWICSQPGIYMIKKNKFDIVKIIIFRHIACQKLKKNSIFENFSQL